MRLKEPERELPDGPFRLFLDDVRDLVAIIGQHSDQVRVSTAKHHLDSVDEMRDLDDPIDGVEIEGLVRME